MSKDKTKVYKIVIVIFIVAIIAVAVYGFTKNYLPQQKRNAQIKDYKIGLYNTVLCEYGCPLSEQMYNGTKQLLPTVDCVKNCTSDFQSKWKTFNPTKEELITDNLFPDIGLVINDCKKGSFNETQMKVNNTLFFSCSANSLEKLKLNYSYLR